MASESRVSLNRLSALIPPFQSNTSPPRTGATPPRRRSRGSASSSSASSAEFGQMSNVLPASWPLPESGLAIIPQEESPPMEQMYAGQMHDGMPVAVMEPAQAPLVDSLPLMTRPRSASSSMLASQNPPFHSGPVQHLGPQTSEPQQNLTLSHHPAARQLLHRKSENVLRSPPTSHPHPHPLPSGARAASLSVQGQGFSPSPNSRVEPARVNTGLGPSSPAGMNKLRRMSWITSSAKGSSKSKNKKEKDKPPAWVIGHPEKIPYDLIPLLSGSQVPELWNPEGNVQVYLFPPAAGCGPSFCVDDDIFMHSVALTQLAHGKSYSRKTHGSQSQGHRVSVDPRTGQLVISVPSGSPPMGPSATSSYNGSEGSIESRGPVENEPKRQMKLNLSINISQDGLTGAMSLDDVERLVSVRNLFAFLVGQSLVAIQRKSTAFAIFLQTGYLLNQYGFSNGDGTTFGDIAAGSFDNYVGELGLADVRASREKTIEAIVLGERMRSALLYNEAFIHGVGKLDSMQALKSAKYNLISKVTQLRLERSHLKLEDRVKVVNTKLADFDLQTVFAGLMSSSMREESKNIGEWKSAFLATRKFVLSYYKQKYGTWLPKAKSKRNELETDGLNRLVLCDLERDFAALYDLLVDRSRLTTRGQNVGNQITDDDLDPRLQALRIVLGEYDISGVPVLPPVPFDVPVLPGHSVRQRSQAEMKKLAQKKFGKNELSILLNTSYNPDTANVQNHFLAQYKVFEQRNASGMTLSRIADFRIGSWLFVYCVLQSLPLLVVDSPGVKYSEGVEYFLCMPPLGGLPWARGAENQSMGWYQRTEESGYVLLSKETIEFAVEGVYQRSHCWRAAEKWAKDITGLFDEAAIGEALNPQSNPQSQPQGQPQAHLPSPQPETQSQFVPAGYQYAPQQELPLQHVALQQMLPPQLSPQIQQAQMPPQQAFSQQQMYQPHNPAHYPGQQPAQQSMQQPMQQPAQYFPEQQFPPQQYFAAQYPQQQQSPYQQPLPMHQSSPNLSTLDPNFNPPAFRFPDMASSGHLEPPPPVIPAAQDDWSGSNSPNGSQSRSNSPMRHRGNRSSIVILGQLEALPIPAASSLAERTGRSPSGHTFDDFLGAQHERQRSSSNRRSLLGGRNEA